MPDTHREMRMAKRSSAKGTGKTIEALTHSEEKRKNIPTAEYQSVLQKEQESPRQVKYPRNTDLDPQLVWRGKDEQDWSDLVTYAPPLYIQEKVHPKVLIDDLLRQSKVAKDQQEGAQTDLFADFNGIPEGADKTEFYHHDQNWSNRMILGDSLQVMASLAEREGLRGKVQCIYLDPPYGIKFNSNFQWSTTSRDVKDGNAGHITREPEMVKAFRDTWRDGIHSYLTYLRDRLTVARDLLTESGSIFVQISDENLHRIRALLDEVFGGENFVAQITMRKTGAVSSPEAKLNSLGTISDYIVWYSKRKEVLKYRQIFTRKTDSGTADQYRLSDEFGNYQSVSMESNGYAESFHFPISLRGRRYTPAMTRHWSTTEKGIYRVASAGRVIATENKLRFKKYLSDFAVTPMANIWADLMGTSGLVYVVQTNEKIIERCILMSSDPGDLVLDPTCGSGTTAYAAEQWGRRWITIDTSRVALALARARIMGARYPFYLLADSREGQEKEGEVTQTAPSTQPVHGNIRHGFVYERVPHITLKSIANNAEIDVIWERFEQTLEPLRDQLSVASGQKKTLEEWEVPREKPANWPQAAQPLLTAFWEARIARQKAIDASIAAKAEFEYLYDKPYTDSKKVRVAGPFTVESLSPHRVLGVDENDDLIDSTKEGTEDYVAKQSFPQMILENLKAAGVQQAHREDRIVFTSLVPWPGELVCAEGRFEVDSDQWLVAGEVSSGQCLVDSGLSQATSHKSLTTEKRAAIFIGPEFGTVQRADLVAAAREAGDAGFDVLIACAFNYEAHTTEFNKLGRLPVLKARMNADLHMADDLKSTGKGNLFVIFGEPDIEVVSGQWLVAGNGRMIANYERVKELSGLGSLEEINRLGGTDLPGFKRLSAGGALRSDQSTASGGGVGAVQHRGGGGADGDRGVSAVSKRGRRVAGGGRDSADDRGPAATGAAGAGGSAAVPGGGTQQNAGRAQALAAVQTLSASDFPLSLTTDHYAQITVHGVDVFKPQTGEVISDNADGIACWFIDTDYNEESFFVRHAYFLGQNDPYSALKTTLKAEINEDAWATLHSDTSRPFEKPKSGRIAVKVINHLGDEVMKVFRIA